MWLVSILGVRSNLAALLLGIGCIPAAPLTASFTGLGENRGSQAACTARNAKPVSFWYIDKHSMDRELECIKLSGFVYRGAIYRTRQAALSDDEPDWQVAGLWREDRQEEFQSDFAPAAPQKATIIGALRDCGTSNIPHYCHYVGGPIINVQFLNFNKVR